MAVGEVIKRLHLIPASIETFSMSQSAYFGKEAEDFFEVLKQLPITIINLDLSDNLLGLFKKKTLIQLFSDIPPHIKKIKLHHNHLINLSKKSIKEMFKALQRKDIVLDIGDNGFDRLVHTEINHMLDAIPETVLITFGDKKLNRRTDGALVPAPLAIQPYGFFNSSQPMRHQRHFARLRLIMMEIMNRGHLNFEMGCIILSYLINEPLSDIKRKYTSMEMRMITSISPDETTSEMRRECRQVVQYRISNIVAGATKLDLSRCGLNRLDHGKWLRNQLKNIPKHITHVNLRGNGLQSREEGRLAFFMALGRLSERIVYLDLSENGFELCDYDKLHELIVSIPNTVKFISIGNEVPLSPANQLARRRWPRNYLTMTDQAEELLEKIHILLQDYTKNSSLFLRIMTGHWNRHYTAHIEKLLCLVDKGIISNTTDLIAELDQVPLQNHGGSLSRRLSFLSHAQAKIIEKKRNPAMLNIDGGLDDIEMQDIHNRPGMKA